MLALIINGNVSDLKEVAYPVNPVAQWRSAPVGCEIGWIVDESNQIVPPPVPQKSSAQLIKENSPSPDERLQALWDWALSTTLVGDRTQIDSMQQQIMDAEQTYG